MRGFDNSESDGHWAPVNETAARKNAHLKRSRARPVGSKNKVSRGGRAVLEEFSGPVMREIWRDAIGKPYYRRRADGSRWVFCIPFDAVGERAPRSFFRRSPTVSTSGSSVAPLDACGYMREKPPRPR